MRQLLLAVCFLASCFALGCRSTAMQGREVDLPYDDCSRLPDIVRRTGLTLPLGPSAPEERQAPLPCLAFYRSVQERPAQDGTKAVAVAISGGGQRASNFALGVLVALESFALHDQSMNLLREIDYFSTVSGGGFAAGAYLSNRHDYLKERASVDVDRAAREYSLAREAFITRTNLRHDLERGLQRSMYRAALQPGLGRQEYLEQRLDDIMLRSKSRGRSLTLGDIFVPDCAIKGVAMNEASCEGIDPTRRVQMPYWFANGSVVGNGAIFPFSPDILTLYGVTGYRHRRQNYVLSDPYAMPLAVGMTASASFPIGVPPTTLRATVRQGSKATPYEIQLLDGGIADNLGVITAVSVLEQDQAKFKVLLVVDAYIGTYQPYQPLGRRLSTLGVARRVPSLYLDSWRGRHRYVVRNMVDGVRKSDETWKVIFLSFDELMASPSLLDRMLRRSVPEHRKELYSLVRSIGTNFNISNAQQQALLEAGMMVVETKRRDLCAVFSCLGEKKAPE